MREDSQKLDGPGAKATAKPETFYGMTDRKGGRTSFLEWMINDNIRCIESGPADTRLSDAQALLGAARQRISDFIDGNPRTMMAMAFPGEDGQVAKIIRPDDPNSIIETPNPNAGVLERWDDEAHQRAAGPSRSTPVFEPAFDEGDVVVLNGHQRIMTIICSADEGSAGEALCAWFNVDGALLTEMLPEAALRAWPRRT